MNGKIKGVLFSGAGEGRKYLEKSEYHQFFTSLLGEQIFLGTLNLRIPKKWKEISGWKVFKPEKYGKIFYTKGKITKVKHTLCEMPILIIRPALTKHKENVIEVVAKKHLRKMFTLHDGDEITLKLPI